jgi:MFS family permease
MSQTRPVTRRTAAAAATASPRLSLALLGIATAQLMVVLDATIVNVALPHIQRALGFSGSGLEWVVNAYALAFGGLMLLGGRAGDLLGRRRMFIAGLLLFSAASLAGGSPPPRPGCSRPARSREPAPPSPRPRRWR